MSSEITPPELEHDLGLLAYKTNAEGVGGRIKQAPEDFVVEEITPDGVVVSVEGGSPGDETPGEFTHFTLVKTNWDTMRAVKEVSRRVGVSQRRFSFAGTKDRRAVSAQRVSVWGVGVGELGRVKVKDLVLKDFGYGDEPVELGGLWGNRFTITVRDVEVSGSELKSKVSGLVDGLKSGFPNFFGLQRFGIVRPITHLVGKRILKGDLEGAVRTYLCETFEGVEEEEKRVREELARTWDVKRALKDFPKRLGYEKAMLNHLLENPGDYPGALRCLPVNLQIMFVHAYQAYVFNRALSAYVGRGVSVERLPLVGFESEPDDESLHVLDEEGIVLKNFKIAALPKLSSRGGVRDCFKEIKDFEVVGWGPLTLRFNLPAGCYATVVLREFLKNEWWR